MERVQIKRQIPCIATKFMQSSEKKQRTHTHTSVQSPFETLTIQHALYQSHLSWRVNIFYCCFCLCWSRCVCFFVLLVAGLLFVIWRVHKPLLECVSKRKSDCKKNSIRGLTPHLPFKWQLYFYGFAHSFFCCCFLFDHKLINNNKKNHTHFSSLFMYAVIWCIFTTLIVVSMRNYSKLSWKLNDEWRLKYTTTTPIATVVLQIPNKVCESLNRNPRENKTHFDLMSSEDKNRSR